MNFGDAADSKASEEFVYRNDGWTIRNHLWIIPPCDSDQALKERMVAQISGTTQPKEDLVYLEKG